MSTRDETFTSHGTRCGATWYDAAGDALRGPDGVPCVVMAHGFGCTRDGGLARYAERFAAAGAHVLAFDYRCLGTSEGRPRQLVSWRRQRQDFHAAVAHARRRPDVDAARVALWGTSYSGGHVVAVAARDHSIAAVVAQGAAVDGLAILTKSEKADPRAPADKGRRMLLAALRDAGHALTGREPVRVDSVGEPGELALLTDPDSYADYLAMMGPTWRKEVCARSLLTLALNRPVLMAGRVVAPTLLVLAEQDTIAPPASVRETARRIGEHAELLSFDCPHFELYRDPVLEESVAAQTTFLSRALARR